MILLYNYYIVFKLNILYRLSLLSQPSILKSNTKAASIALNLRLRLVATRTALLQYI